VAAEAKISLDPLLDPSEAELFQSCDRRLGERLVGEVGQRGTPPQRERLTQKLRRRFGLAVRESASSSIAV